jgi:hypothetical protein
MYDNPQRVETVVAMFQRGGATVTFAGSVHVGAESMASVVRAIRK